MTQTPDICVIVPTIREYDVVRDYAANAERHGFDTDRLHVVLVTEEWCDLDAMEAMLKESGLSGGVFDGHRRHRWLADHGVAEYEHLIPAASHAQTSFGLLYLWANGFEYGVFLDDDTRPHREVDFFGRHLRNLQYEGPIETVGSDTGWVNVLHHRYDDHGLYPRGYPYAAMGETSTHRQGRADDIVVSQGLWTDVPDLDAVRILADGDLDGQATTRLTTEDFGPSFIVEQGQYLTVCSMNLAFRREVVPAFYQLPMDDNPWDVGRFDDIWSGLFLKRACDVVGSQLLTGYPLCRHEKAPRSTFSDLATEVAGLELNEHLWRLVDGLGVNETSYAGVSAAIAEELASGQWDEFANGGFLNHVGEHMADWLVCLEALEPVTTAVSADD